MRARVVVDLNLSGWQMAHQRSTLMTLRVRTETLTETPCNRERERDKVRETRSERHGERDTNVPR